MKNLLRVTSAVLMLSVGWVTTAQADPITTAIFGAAFALSGPGLAVSLAVTAATCYVVMAPKRRSRKAAK